MQCISKVRPVTVVQSDLFFIQLVVCLKLPNFFPLTANDATTDYMPNTCNGSFPECSKWFLVS